MKRTARIYAAALACLLALTAAGCKKNESGNSASGNAVSSAQVSEAESPASEKSEVESSSQSGESESSALGSSENESAAQSGESESSALGSSENESTAQSNGGESSASEGSENESTAQSNEGLWENAHYTEDAEIGEGAYSVLIEVEIEGKSVTLTLRSDKDNLADILTENGIAEGDESEFGLYIKKVNGVRADYDADGAYWALNKDGEPTATGASGITVTDGEHYELVYTKA